MDIATDPRFPDDKITAMTVAPSGAAKVTFKKRGALELDRVKDTTRIDALTETTWQRDWQLVARMPSGTHDLSGDVLNGKFYVDWAITGDFGYPSAGKFHSALLEFDPAPAQWRIVADYRPTKCSREYRMIVLRKNLTVEKGEIRGGRRRRKAEETPGGRMTKTKRNRPAGLTRTVRPISTRRANTAVSL